MQPGVPPSTALVMQARVLPPDSTNKATQIDFLVDVHDLQFLMSDDHRRQPNLMFVAAAWDEHGKAQGSVVGHLSADPATVRCAGAAAHRPSLAASAPTEAGQLSAPPGTRRPAIGKDRHYRCAIEDRSKLERPLLGLGSWLLAQTSCQLPAASRLSYKQCHPERSRGTRSSPASRN